VEVWRSGNGPTNPRFPCPYLIAKRRPGKRIRLPTRDETYSPMSGGPPPKPNRARLLARHYIPLVVIVAAICLAFRTTRPPALVWWRSPEIGKNGPRLRVLIPNGWGLKPKLPLGVWEAGYELVPTDSRPRFLRRIFPHQQETAWVSVVVFPHPAGKPPPPGVKLGLVRTDRSDGLHTVHSFGGARGANRWADIYYTRTNLSAFNATYKQICNSLRIE
jgi:hypothetical protein